MEEITKERAKRMVNNALNTRNGPNTEALHDLPPNSPVLVYREKGGWKGPFPLIGITGETCKVKLSSGVTDFRSTHVKLYYEESTVGDSDGDQSDREQVDEGDQSHREQVDEGEEEQEAPIRRPQRNRQRPERFQIGRAHV